jgi:hypothetical protein
MPLLYGEGGNKAFIRLQLELLKKSDDESIFAWDALSHDGCPLAVSPEVFPTKGIRRLWSFRMPYAMTNKGLEMTIDLPSELKLSGEPWASTEILMPLNCCLEGENRIAAPLAIEIVVSIMSEDHRILVANRARRRHRWLIRGTSRGDIEETGQWHFEKQWYEAWECIVGQERGPTTQWKVYFHQNHL